MPQKQTLGKYLFVIVNLEMLFWRAEIHSRASKESWRCNRFKDVTQRLQTCKWMNGFPSASLNKQFNEKYLTTVHPNKKKHLPISPHQPFMNPFVGVTFPFWLWMYTFLCRAEYPRHPILTSAAQRESGLSEETVQFYLHYTGHSLYKTGYYWAG